MSPLTLVAGLLVAAGAFFLLASAVGLARLPDFYSRTHAAGKSETMGAMLLLAGLTLHLGWSATSLKLLLILAFIALTSPSGLHAISRAAVRSGLEIWSRRSGGSTA